MKIHADARAVADLKERLIELNVKAQEIQNAADSAGRSLTDQEETDIASIFAEFERTEAEITRRERIAADASKLARPNPRVAVNQDTLESPQPARRVEVRSNLLNDTSKWGFSTIGEFAQAVMKASNPGGYVDNRLVIRGAPTSIGTEGTGEDGGFAVPPEFRREIMIKVMGEDNLISRTDSFNTSSNNLVIPVDETTPWQTSGGILAYWDDEAQQHTQSKPNLKQASVRLNKLTALVGVSDELLQDAPAMDSYLRRKAPEKINFKLNLAIVQGDGVGKPLGIMNSPALVTVSAESGPQTADTVVVQNIVKMYSRMYRPSLNNAVWLVNQDVLPQLYTMTISGSSSGVFPVFLPPSGVASSPFGTLMGRPIVITEACETIGDLGDIIFADLTQYMTAVKASGITTDTSMHLWFDYSVMAFRFVLRVAGQPWWSAPIDRRDGSNTLSCFVTLAAR